MKTSVLIIGGDDADCRTISESAIAQGCRVSLVNTAAEALSSLDRETPAAVFCDLSVAGDGRMLRAVSEAAARACASVHLVMSSEIKRGLIRALRPWVDDYLAAPVLREAASARIRSILHVRRLEQEAEHSKVGMQSWLARLENATRYFEPLSYDASRSQDDLAQRVICSGTGDRDGPSCFMVARTSGAAGLLCDIYTRGSAGVDRIGSAIPMPEAAIFHLVRAEHGATHVNHFDRGGSLADFQAHFPPEIHQTVGTIRNMTACRHGDAYFVAFNYGRPATAQDALFLKGLALPGSFLAAIAGGVLDMSESFLVMVRTLAMATDSAGDNGAHVLRMNEYARTLAESMELPERFVKALSYSAQLHDVGKIYIHPDLLEKPLRLTHHEFDLVKKHTLLGANILGDSPMLRTAKNIALTHHECWDGSGYPAGLAGDSIPLEGAIVKVADVYDALRTMHSYKPSYSHDDACRIILDGGGDGLHEIRPTHFHPAALRIFGKISHQFEAIYSAAL